MNLSVQDFSIKVFKNNNTGLYSTQVAKSSAEECNVIMKIHHVHQLHSSTVVIFDFAGQQKRNISTKKMNIRINSPKFRFTRTAMRIPTKYDRISPYMDCSLLYKVKIILIRKIQHYCSKNFMCYQICRDFVGPNKIHCSWITNDFSITDGNTILMLLKTNFHKISKSFSQFSACFI